jgi:hypothetical protein
MLEFSDGTQCEVREAYVDADAFVEHAFHVRKARDTLFGDFAYNHQMTIYGEPLPRLVELFDRVGGGQGLGKVPECRFHELVMPITRGPHLLPQARCFASAPVSNSIRDGGRGRRLIDLRLTSIVRR